MTSLTPLPATSRHVTGLVFRSSCQAIIFLKRGAKLSKYRANHIIGERHDRYVRMTTDLAALPSHAVTAAHFRKEMVAQFEREQRGPAWVSEGKLVPRPRSQKYGPNYPGKVVAA